MQAIIQAGGAGTRLKSITGDLPKPMVSINGKPILEWQILSLKQSGIVDVTVVISKNGNAIKEYFKDGKDFGVKIRYIVEEIPLGTAGGLYFAKEFIKDDFFLVFGDLMLDIDWERYRDYALSKKALLVPLAHPNSHPFDSDLLVTDESNKILRIDSKHNVRDYYYKNLTNAGIYWCDHNILELIDEPKKIDFEKEILTSTIERGAAFVYKSSEYVKDCGTPDRYYSVENDCKNGIISAKRLSNKQKAIFLDRDGTINVFGDFVRDASKLELIDVAPEAIKLIDESEYLPIVITNQPVIARGETTFDELARIHNKMEVLLGEKNAYLTDIYFCPHHPDSGYEGEVKELKIVCDCRKPKIGMLLKAAHEYNIDLSKSWFIGDTSQDVQTGINAGCKSIKVTSGDPRPNRKYENAVPDYVANDILEAVKLILNKK